MKKRTRILPQPFTSQMSRGQIAAALIYLPIHVVLLPWLVTALWGDRLNAAQLNFACYAAAIVYMLLFQWHFLRRDFDPLWERPMRIVLEVFACYGWMLLCNLVLNFAIGVVEAALTQAEPGFAAANPNNNAVLQMANTDYGMVNALALFLAPIVEELIFRAAIFSLLYRRSRAAAYVVSILLFAVYHVWGYALSDPIIWLYLLQYLPVSYLLCRCYERCNSVWGSIFMHMLVNFISLRAAALLQELL